MSIETNCFRIEGLEALRTTYSLYRIAGLHRDSPEYHANVQRIVRKLSFEMRAPVTTRNMEGGNFLAVPTKYGHPPAQIPLVHAVALLKDTGREIDLDFTSNSPELDALRLRYLQFVFQGPLWTHSQLWQPSAGKPYFFKRPERRFGEVDLYEGFTFRVVPHPEGGLGLIVDLRRKLVSKTPLPSSPLRQYINKLRGRSCVYKMGHNWFEITLDGLADVKAGDPFIPFDGKAVSLIDYLTIKSRKPVPPSIANLAPDDSAIYYRTNGPGQKSAPTALCYLVQDTHSREGARHHHETTINPQERYRQIDRLVRKFLKEVRVGNTTLTVSERPGRERAKPFSPPSLRFGNDAVLAIDGDNKGDRAALKDYGKRRLTLLKDTKAGFYEQSRLNRQYLVLPQSVWSSVGAQFREDLMREVDELYPAGGGYEPEVIVYDDPDGRRSFGEQSRAIEGAVEDNRVNPGHALVMVHRYERRPRSADQLAAWTAKQFPSQFGLKADVIHTDMVKKAYARKRQGSETRYVVKHSERRRFSGYLRNVALNKVLLINGKWPFVLDTALHADVVIGIDVKNNTAAFTLIADGGKIIRFSMSPSRQKEQLLKAQVEQYVYKAIREEAPNLKQCPKQIVIHRDGRAWHAEIEGLREACKYLASDGHLNSDWQLAVVEIRKSAPAPLRMFDVKRSRGDQMLEIENPMVGTWVQTAPDEGFVCTTGQPFPTPGTSKPLHIRRAEGDMPIEHCLSDVYSLSCLTWTRPEVATRLPLSLKLCDRNLFDEAAEYDQDAIEFEDSPFQREGAK